MILQNKQEMLIVTGGISSTADRRLAGTGLTAELAAWALESRKKRSQSGTCRQTCRSTAATRVIAEPSCSSGKLRR